MWISLRKHKQSKKSRTGSVDLSSIMQVAQAGTEGCISTPGFNTGVCILTLDGTWGCFVYPYGELNCSGNY